MRFLSVGEPVPGEIAAPHPQDQQNPMIGIGRHQRIRAAGEGSPCQDCCWLFRGWRRGQQHKANSPQANSFPYGHRRRLFFVEPRTAAPATPSSGEVSLGVAPEPVETILRVKNLLPDALKVLGDAQAVASSREQSRVEGSPEAECAGQSPK
jgi:hypothetical protein